MREKLLLCCLMLLLATASGADFEAGFAAYSRGDYETALAEWQPLAEQGDASSQFGLGLLYANGFGVAMDDAQALKWYGLAADQGHAEAQYNLGVMYQNGWGVEQSDADTVKW
ncbi:MAG: tetratricopeptide repeat protein, partial [Woeseiaceae bacterium]